MNRIRLLTIIVSMFLIAVLFSSVGCSSHSSTGGSTQQAPGIEWSKTFGGSGDDYGYSVQQTGDGGFIVVGGTYSSGAGKSDAYLIKTNASGNEQWNKTFGDSGDDVAVSVQQTSDGGFVIAGSTTSSGAGGADVYLIKTNASGNKQWSKTFGGSGDDKGWSVQQTGDGGFVIAGSTASSGAGGVDVYLIRTNASGNEQWSKKFGGSGYDSGDSVRQTGDGGFVIAGETTSSGAGKSDVYLIKTDASGNERWNKTFGGSGDDLGYSVRQTSDGGFVIAGWTASSGAGGVDVYLVKTDASGNEQWSKMFGGSGDDYGYSVQQTSDGGFVIAGYTKSSGAGGNDVYLVKISSTATQK